MESPDYGTENSFYRRRVNAVIDYLQTHLDERPSLADLAAVGNFSEFHFHRIFRAVTGETVLEYATRIRMARIARSLVWRRDRTLTDIAFDMGYRSSANFSRDVTRFYRTSPSQIRKTGRPPRQKEAEAVLQQAAPSFAGIRDVPERTVLYVRLQDGYRPESIRKAFADLCAYAMEHFRHIEGEQLIGIGYDDPDYTDPDKCRYDACIALKKAVDPASVEPFNLKTVAGGKYAVFRFSGKGEDINAAWQAVFRDWVVHSEWMPDDRPHLEAYLPSPRYTEDFYEAELCLPVARIPKD